MFMTIDSMSLFEYLEVRIRFIRITINIFQYYELEIFVNFETI